MDEYTERVEEVMTATTLADLGRARRDLPFLRIPEVASGRAGRNPRRAGIAAGSLLAPLLALSVLAIAGAVILAVALSWLWALVLVAGWLIGLVQARLLQGPAGGRGRGPTSTGG